jgi:hypothetical protein
MTKKQRIISGGMTLLVLGVVGFVYAAWTTSGNGSGYAKATEAKALTTTNVSATTVGQLYPGGSGDVKLEINNPNDYPVRITDVVKKTGSPITSNVADCTLSTGVSFTDQENLDQATPKIDIAAKSSESVTFEKAASMSNASATECQGATFTIPVELSGRSNAS